MSADKITGRDYEITIGRLSTTEKKKKIRESRVSYVMLLDFNLHLGWRVKVNKNHLWSTGQHNLSFQTRCNKTPTSSSPLLSKW